MKIELLPTHKMVTVSVTNESPERRFLQIESYSWDQENNQDVEKETADLIVFPTYLSLDPGEKKDIQIKPREGAADEVERPYRVLMKEIPSEENQVKNGITVLVNYKTAFYIKPKNRKQIISPECTIVRENDKKSLKCHNPNDEHVVLRQVKYKKDEVEKNIEKEGAELRTEKAEVETDVEKEKSDVEAQYESIHMVRSILAGKEFSVDIDSIPEDKLKDSVAEFLANGQTYLVNPTLSEANAQQAETTVSEPEANAQQAEVAAA